MKSYLKSEIKNSFILELNEEEAKALNALTLYGTDSFLNMFYKQLGKHYLKPYENGLRSLFDGISDNLEKDIYQANGYNDKIKRKLNE